ncbi:MAG: low specificity L-threonine aldolase [Dysgonamonadaceae bacterium]|nr:low specificity L-threonine aldolase [Dysgonamonadaceae bacterium]
MRSFASDNNSGIHPQILDAIQRANEGHAVGYGADDWTRKADACFAEIFGKDIVPYYVFNGTGANMVALQACTLPFHSIITAETGHINVDECGAPSKFTSCMVKEIATPDGKLTPELISGRLHGIGDQHHSQPKVVYLSQVTELGTTYTAKEIKAICDFAHKNNLYVHMDGSRLANAAAFLNTGLRELTRDCGIDILSLGGTKNGMMIGEAVVSFRPELSENLKYFRKQSAQLYSKMRFLSAQYLAYFKDDLWLKNALKANNMALELASRLEVLPGIRITQKVESNALFLTMPPQLIQQLLQSYFFYFWNEPQNEIRLVCSWDTTEEDIEQFVKKVISYQL